MREMTQTSEPPTGQPFPPLVERVVGRASRPLGWLWDRGFRFLFMLDAVGLMSTMILINLVRFGFSWPRYSVGSYLLAFAAATAIHLTVNYFSGLYERQPRLGYRPWLPRCTMATAIAIGIDASVALTFDRYLMPRLNLGILFILASLGLTMNRAISRVLADRRRGPSRLVLVGAGQEVRMAESHFAHEPLADVVAKTDTTDDLLVIVDTHRATDVLLLDLDAFASVFPEPLTTLDLDSVGVLQRVTARETLLGLQSINEIAGMPFTRVRTHAMAPHQLRLKRLFDLTLVVLTLPLSILVLALLALYVRLRAGRGVLYRQTRVGLWGKPFEVVKFRTMHHNAETNGAQLATRDDARVVRGLAWMRSTRADELPQLWNVLRGQMSLVGPRPERPELVREIEKQVPGYGRRDELPPGITGFAQVYGRYHTDATYKLGYDLQYIVSWSVVLDVQILLRTVIVVLMRRV